MRILITGSRDWRDYATIYEALRDYPNESTVVHGAATGADHMAHSAATALSFIPEPHFPKYHLYVPKEAPKERNKLMVELGAEICLAFPTKNSRGTYHCTNLAEQAGIEVIWFKER